MRKLKWIVPVTAALVMGWSAARAQEVDEATKAHAAKLATETCSACHGASGKGSNPTFPNLAGQQSAYLVKQLKAFRDHSRGEPAAHDFMWGMAKTLDDKTIDGLAAYFSAQAPAKGTAGDAALMARGRETYEKGIEARLVPACALCHGPDAAGQGEFPRLAGQHADYVFKQLSLIQAALRAVPAMHGIVQTLTVPEMKALGAYLESR